MTQLPNPFLNSVAPSPAATETAAADQVAPQVAAAEPFAVSPGVGTALYPSGESEPSVMLALAPGENRYPLSDGVPLPSLSSMEMEPSVTLAQAPSETEGAVSVSTASSDNLGCLTAADEALYWQLRRADNPFTRDLAEIPDPHALFDAIEPPPLFLQRQA